MSEYFNQYNQKSLSSQSDLQSILRKFQIDSDIDDNLKKIPKKENGLQSTISYEQESLWAFHTLYPAYPNQNLSCMVTISGKFYKNEIIRTIKEIIDRHRILKTRFIWRDNKPEMVVDENCVLNISEYDMSSGAVFDKDLQLQKIIKRELQQPFDLTQPPHIRLVLIRLDQNTFKIILTLHHIVSDECSLKILFREFVILYTAYIGQCDCKLPDLSIQYEDYAAWQHNVFDKNEFERDLEYWKSNLTDGQFYLELPIDYDRPKIRTFDGECHIFNIPKSVSVDVNNIALKNKTTSEIFYMAVFKILLWKICNQRDLIIGNPVECRNNRETANLIGCFLNILPIRTVIDPAMTFNEFLCSLHVVVNGAHKHKLPHVDAISKQLKVNYNPAFNPVYQVGFSFDDEFLDVITDDLQIKFEKNDSEVAIVDLLFNLTKDGEQISGKIVYKSKLFASSTINRISDKCVKLLSLLVSNPQIKLAAVSLEGDEERLILKKNSGIHLSKYDNMCIHSVFEHCVQKSPTQVALVYKDRKITYDELNRKANQIAHYLIIQGIGPEDIVGLSIDRSPEMIIGLWGILKAGAAYLPLDPKYPRERLMYMLENGNVTTLLTHGEFGKELSNGGRRHVICLEKHLKKIFMKPDHNPDRHVVPENSAYILYTSGSTGQPKGVIVPHKGVCNLLNAQRQVLNIEQGDAVLQFASLNYDASIWEIIAAHCHGATLVIGDSEDMLPGTPLVNMIQTHSISHVAFPPIVLSTLPLVPLPSLKSIIVEGEICSVDLASKWFSVPKFINAYGVTESTVCSTFFETDGIQSLLPIGKAIPNTQILLIDEFYNLVPVGAVGEICISGNGVARGYLGSPSLTALRFVPNPWGKQPGERMYRTGDLGRMLPNGQIEFIGRIDRQVKIRGFRVEIEEIESVIASYPAIRAQAVTTYDNHTHKGIVAYIVWHKGQEHSINKILSFIRMKVPEHMVPNVVIEMDALPLTNSGKVNYSFLPNPQSYLSTLNDYKEPSNEKEKMIAAIWCELLCVDKISADKSIFELGADSILIMNFISKAKCLGLIFEANHIFQFPTVEMLALFVERTAMDCERFKAEFE